MPMLRPVRRVLFWDFQPHFYCGEGHDGFVCACFVGYFQSAFYGFALAGAVRKDCQYGVHIYLIGFGDCDGDYDVHIICAETHCGADAEGVVPQCVSQRSLRWFGVLTAVNIGSHAHLKGHSSSCQRYLPSIFLR